MVATLQVEWVVAPTVATSDEVIEFGRSQGWNCQALGQAPMPQEPVKVGQWLVVPADLDTATGSARVQAKLAALKAAGLVVTGVVIAHELPTDPATQTQAPLSSRLHPAVKKAAIAIGMIALAVLVMSGLGAALKAALTFIGAALIPLILVVGAFAVDPILIVVCGPDNTWVELDRWS